jgi:hypothetical protein
MVGSNHDPLFMPGAMAGFMPGAMAGGSRPQRPCDIVHKIAYRIVGRKTFQFRALQ